MVRRTVKTTAVVRETIERSKELVEESKRLIAESRRLDVRKPRRNAA